MSNKSQAAQAESKRPGGPGTKYRPKSISGNPSSVSIPSKTIATSPNSSTRGKDGK